MNVMNIFTLALRELRRLLRDPNLLLVIFIAPLAYSALYGAIYWNKIEVEVPIDVIDQDGSALSRGLARNIDALQQVRIADTRLDESSIRSRMAAGSIHAALIIPSNFSTDIKRGKSCNVHLVISPGRLLVLSDVAIGISRAVSTYGARITAVTLAAQGVPVMADPSHVQPLSFSYNPLYNTWLTYGDMILPPLMVIIIMQLVFIGSAAATASEWSTQGWRELFSAKRSSTNRLVAGKLLMMVVVFTLFVLLLRVTIIPLFDIYIGGESLAILLFVIVGLGAAAAAGMFVGSFFRHRLTAFVVLGFTSYPFFMVSGYAWPDGQLPILIQWLARLLPTTPMLKGLFSLTQINAGVAQMLPQLVNLLGLMAVFALLASWRFSVIRRRFTTQLPPAC